MKIPLTWVDAFTDRPFGGNPAAVCTLEAPADEGWMQALAHELGISETAFVEPRADGFSLRWFTPTTEVDLCGHATLAAAHVLGEDGRVQRDAEVRFHTRSGQLRAHFDGDLIELDFPADPPSVAELPGHLGALAEGVLDCRRAAFFLMVVLDAEEKVANLSPDLAALARLPDRAVIVTAAGERPGIDYVLRVFGPNVGIDEDPVTGSAQCVAGPYWSERLGQVELVARQMSRRGGTLRVGVDGERVRIAGQAVTVLRGQVDGRKPADVW